MDFRKLKDELKAQGEIPNWYSTNTLQFFMDRYSYKGESVKSRDETTNKMLAKYAPTVYPDWWEKDEYFKGLTWEEAFTKLSWDGYSIYSTPLKANGGVPERGLTVSCCGQHMDNSVASKAFIRGELEVLIKNSHGCSMDVSSWLSEGTVYDSDGNISDGIEPIIDDYQDSTEAINQGIRRGQTLFAVDALHGDFWKIVKKLYLERATLNIAWLMSDELILKLQQKDVEVIKRWEEILYVRMTTGKGYFTKIDTMNRNKAQTFKNLNLKVHASNLCNEVNLPANEEYSFTCVIVNANLTLWDTFPEHLFHVLHIIQDCNVSNYIDTISRKKGLNALFLSKVKKFTEDFRAVGTGVAGFHSLLMQKRYVFGEFESLWLNEEIFKRMQKDTHEANVWLADVMGVPKGIEKAGLHLRNATTMMMPPTKSSSELSRNSPTEGINPETALVKVKESVAGDLPRINTDFLKLMKERGMYSTEEVQRIAMNKGSVQDCDWLTQHEKDVFRIAFEIPMEDHLALCSQRQVYIDQQQSINLFFSGSDSEEYIGKIHKLALEDENINGLYYCYSSRGGKYVRPESCANCQ